MIPKEFSLSVRVYIEDTDPGGIVYYVNYLKFMERARTEFMRSLGFDRATTFTDSFMFVVRNLEVSYISPAFLDDELTVSVSVTNVGGASLNMYQSISRGGQKLVESNFLMAVIDRAGLTPRRLPETMFLALRSAVVEKN